MNRKKRQSSILPLTADDMAESRDMVRKIEKEAKQRPLLTFGPQTDEEEMPRRARRKGQGGQSRPPS